MTSDGPILVTADGLALATRAWPVQAPRAAVVLSHGFGEHCGRYGSLGAALNASCVTLFTYDLRGHGRSAGPRGHAPSLAAYLDDLALVIEWARREAPGAPLFLCGDSAGGNIALNYALRRPAGLAGVIAIAPWLKLAFAPPAWKTALGRLVAGIAPRFTLSSELDAGLLSHDPRVAADYLDDPLNHERISAAAYVALADGGAWALSHAADLLLPCLVLHGGADQITSAEASAEFVAAVRHPDKRYRLFPAMYHEILNELDPRPVLEEIAGWIQRRTHQVGVSS